VAQRSAGKKNASAGQASGPSRRSTLSGLVGTVGALPATGCTEQTCTETFRKLGDRLMKAPEGQDALAGGSTALRGLPRRRTVLTPSV
jgi:hypothetical protein